ncbi:FAD:protein FMN transferase [Candidatus Falkowbacteria bacterium]|nr:FAD:protein FMN transferase [Candidatus Falkowbacteria bacterium]
MTWKKFSALGTEIIISAALKPGEENKIDSAEKEINDFEKRFSRFIVGNELYKLNSSAAGEFEASPVMSDLLREAKGLHEETGGLFDPTIIGSLEDIGYDRSFVAGAQDEETEPVDAGKISKRFAARPRMSELVIDGNLVRKPAGLRIDLGGLGKGYIVDRLADGIFKDVEDFWISAGGDLVIKGNAEGSKGWKVGVQNPNKPEKEIFSVVTKGEKVGVATSGIFKRRGQRGGVDWHHLIDPRTGLPADNNIQAVTAIASSAARADVLAKTVLILGEEEGLRFIDGQPDSACIIFFKDRGLKFSERAFNYF